MATPSSQQVLDALATIKDPDLGRDVVSLGMIKELEVSSQGRVSFTFELTTPACPVRDRFKSQAEDAVGELAGVTAVEVRMTANVRPAFLRPKPSEILPGVKQNEVNVELHGSQLVISGERKQPEGFGKNAFRQLMYGPFATSVALPNGLDVDASAFVKSGSVNPIALVGISNATNATTNRLELRIHGCSMPGAKRAPTAGNR